MTSVLRLALASTHQPRNVNSLNACFERERGKKDEAQGKERRGSRRGHMRIKWERNETSGPADHPAPFHPQTPTGTKEETQLTLALDKISRRSDTGVQSTMRCPQRGLATESRDPTVRTYLESESQLVSSLLPSPYSLSLPQSGEQVALIAANALG